nr:4468_t:CDS:2 [Entrophospora candida]
MPSDEDYRDLIFILKNVSSSVLKIITETTKSTKSKGRKLFSKRYNPYHQHNNKSNESSSSSESTNINMSGNFIPESCPVPGKPKAIPSNAMVVFILDMEFQANCQNIEENSYQNHCYNCWRGSHKLDECKRSHCLGFIKNGFIHPSFYNKGHNCVDIDDSIKNYKEL